MNLSTTPYKGTRDFFPEDFLIREYIFSAWRTVMQSYGYEQYDASLLEPIDIYKAKTSEEIVNEQIYDFTDRGGRHVALRPEMTPTVSRMIAARRQELAYPVRWFSIPNVWRYERPQRGRLREHWQLNADIFGIDNISAEYELIMIATDIMRALGATQEMFVIKINNRTLVDYIIYDHIGLTKEQAVAATRLIDRKLKMEPAAFLDALREICTDKTESLMNILSVNRIGDLPEAIRNHRSFGDVQQLLELLREGGVSNAVFDLTLMRGFDYYTGVVFEVNDTHPDNNRSMFGGGRYDGLVGTFGVDPVPTVGFGMGDVTIRDFLETHQLVPTLQPSVQATVVPVDIALPEALKVTKMIRDCGIAVSVDTTDRKFDKKLKAVSKNNTPFAIIIGRQESDSKTVLIKNMNTGEQSNVALTDIHSDMFTQ